MLTTDPRPNLPPASDDSHRALRYGHSKFGAILSLEALRAAAAQLLADGDVHAAFALADRRCRLIRPFARDLLLRARLHWEAGRDNAAWRDLDAAAALDPTDFTVDRAALEWGSTPLRRRAAEKIALREAGALPLRRTALAVLFEAGQRLVHQLEQGAQGVAGWVAWSGRDELKIAIPGGGEARALRLARDPDHRLAIATASAAQLEIEMRTGDPNYLEFAFEDGYVQRVHPTPQRRRGGGARPENRAPEATGAEPFLTIVVPVYEDFEATRLCLESLETARPAFAHRVLVIDDASPNAAVQAYLDQASGQGRFELLRNRVNFGFAAAVNAALAQRTHGDALLLNADTILSPGVLDRLAALSRSSPGIGTITPFSNNGELTSYPERHTANPTPSLEETTKLNARARAANGDALVDLPNGVGFCLYITEACLAAVPGLPEVYAQGYYEDVEFCLAAREHGFRSVAAPGVFVGHAGSKSFGARKRALVMRNQSLIEARFPGHRLETAAFVEIDPLAPFRAALDAAAPPAGPTVLIAAGPGAARTLARRRAEQLSAQSPSTTVLRVEVARNGGALIVAQGGGAPQSLTFSLRDPADYDAFAAYLGKLELKRVELADPAALPEAALAALLRLETEILLLCADFAWFSTQAAPLDRRCEALGSAQPCESCKQAAALREDQSEGDERRRLRLGRALERATGVVPLDRLAEAFTRRVFKSKARALAPLADDAAAPLAVSSAPQRRLGVLSPQPRAAVDRLLLRIARRLAIYDAEASLIVFGAGIDDAALMATTKAFVTGPASATDYVEMARNYAVDALLAPDRGGGFGDLDALARRLGAPKAYFDWSFGALPPAAGDLSLDPRICEDKAAALIVAWMNPGRQTAA